MKGNVMSHHSDFGLKIVRQNNLADLFDHSIAEWIAGKQVEKNPHYEFHSRGWDQEMHATTRNDWFKDCLRDLTSRSGAQVLSFMNEEYIDPSASDGPKFESTMCKKYLKTSDIDQEFMYAFQSEYSLIKRPISIAFEIDDLIQWIRNNKETVCDSLFLGYEPQEIETQYKESYFSLTPDSQAREDEVHFLFCTLKTISDLLKYAEARGLVAVYVNRQMIPLEKTALF